MFFFDTVCTVSNLDFNGIRFNATRRALVMWV